MITDQAAESLELDEHLAMFSPEKSFRKAAGACSKPKSASRRPDAPANQGSSRRVEDSRENFGVDAGDTWHSAKRSVRS
jgi:hypothetical protein